MSVKLATACGGLPAGPLRRCRIARGLAARRRSRLQFFRHRVGLRRRPQRNKILAKVLRANAGKRLYVARNSAKNRPMAQPPRFTLDDCTSRLHRKYVNKSLANLGVENSTSSVSHLGRPLAQRRTPPSRGGKVRTAGKAEPSGVSVNRWNRTTAFAPCFEGVADASRSSTTFSTRIPRTPFSPLAAMKASP